MMDNNSSQCFQLSRSSKHLPKQRNRLFLVVAVVVSLFVAAGADAGVVINSASFSPNPIAPGGTSTLTWTGSAEGCSIAGGSVTYPGGSGSKVYTNVTSTLSATIHCGAPFNAPAQETVTLTVQVPATPSIPASITASSPDQSGSFGVSWTPPTSGEIVTYALQRQKDNAGWVQIHSGPDTVRTLLQHSLAEGTYKYRVKACNSIAVCGGWAQTGDVLVQHGTNPPQGTPTVPGNFSQPTVNTSGTYQVSWGASQGSVSHYALQRKVGSGGWSADTFLSLNNFGESGLPSNTYAYRVKACNTTNCSGWRNSSVTTVNISGLSLSAENIDTPPTPVLQHSPNISAQEILDSDMATLNTGAFKVNESGAATYSISIMAPGGTAGVAPSVSLSYSSQSGNGVVGMGWALGGMQAVTRCRKTLYHDGETSRIGWSYRDRFCLGGSRLIAVDGVYGQPETIYKTELDSFTKIISKGGTYGRPDYFVVEAKDGSTTTLGGVGADDSETVVHHGVGIPVNDQVLSWGISRFEDSVGNGIEYNYDVTGYTHQLNSIEYAFDSNGLSNASIEFSYGDREDPLTNYVGGWRFEIEQRITNIKTYNSGQLLRDYQLNYQNVSTAAEAHKVSYLSDVTVCESGGNCLNPMTFAWEGTWPDKITPHSFEVNVGYSKDIGDYTFTDINGDGYQDKIWTTTDRGVYYHITGESSMKVLATNMGGSDAIKLIAMDLNNDDKGDLLVWHPQFNRWVGYAPKPYLVNGEAEWILKPVPLTIGFLNKKDIYAGDWNADGLVDIIEKESDKLHVYERKAVPGISNGDVLSPFNVGVAYTSPNPNYNFDNFFGMVDINSDGRSDAIFITDVSINTTELALHAAVVSETNSSEIDVIYSTAMQSKFESLQFGDINGDGLPDIAYRNENDYWVYRMNTGGAFASSIFFPNSTEPQLKGSVAKLVDLNGDNTADLVWNRNSSGRASYWNPTTQSYFALRNYPLAPTDDTVFMDVTANGRMEAITVWKTDKSRADRFDVTSANIGFSPKTVVQFRSGLGNTTDVTYQPILGDSSTFYDSENHLDISNTEEYCYGGQWVYPGRWVGQTCDYPIATNNYYQTINNPYSNVPQGSQTTQVKNQKAFDKTKGMRVVTDVKSSSPIPTDAANMIHAQYKYERGLTQGGGQGFLGFRKLTTFDVDKQVTTETEYRQDWPFTGRPISTVMKSASGKILKQSHRDYRVHSNNFDVPVQVYLNTTEENMYSLVSNGATQGSIISTTWNQFVSDAYGNTTQTVTEIYEGIKQGQYFSRVETNNTYDASEEGKFLGRLISSEATTERPGVDTSITAASVTKRAEFTYYGFNGSSSCINTAKHKGLVCEEKEIVGGTERKVSRKYYDDFGNTQFALTYDNTGQKRLSDFVEYDSSGRYANKTYSVFSGLLQNSTQISNSIYLNAASDIGASVIKTSEVLTRNKFGAAESTRSFNDDSGSGVVAISKFTPFGNVYYAASEDGSYKISTLSSDVSFCPTNSVMSTREQTASGGESKTCLDLLGHKLRVATKAFAGDGSQTSNWSYIDTEYDTFGRVARVSAPYFDGEFPSGWTVTSGFDLLDRTLAITYPFKETDNAGNETGVNASKTTQFNGLTVIETNTKGQSKTLVNNIVGEAVSVTDNAGTTTYYEYDVFGSMIKMQDHAGNTTRIHYNTLGQKDWMEDPNKGRWEYTYTGFGDILCQKDAKGQLIINVYDFKGRQIEKRDYKTGSCNSPSQLESTASWDFDIADHGLGALNVEEKSDGFSRVYTYDALGRTTRTKTEIPSSSGMTFHSSKVTYDQYGRVFQNYDAAREGETFNRGATQNIYDANGFLWKVVNAHRVGGEYAETYYEIESMDARGNITSVNLADGVTQMQTSYHDGSGLIKGLRTTSNMGLNVLQDLTMKWDHVGNLASRHDIGYGVNGQARNLLEAFSYDAINQLKSYAVSGDVSHTTSITYKTDGTGNIHTKSDVGTYSYASGRPHAVASAGGKSYQYDANGNMISGDGRALQYTVFDKVSQITKGGRTTHFYYDGNRSRYKRIDNDTGNQTTTLYLGGVEKVAYNDGSAKWKRNIGGIAQVTMNFTNSNYTGSQTQYLHKDHLGSVTAVSNTNGTLAQTMAFDPWGKRRNTQTWQALAQSSLEQSFLKKNKPITTRGFTGHEMVDEMGIVHMNGRIYDPMLARFMQADPIIQSPLTPGSLNRYSYVLNNPLNATDPTGFTGIQDAYIKLMKADGRWATHQYTGQSAPELHSAGVTALSFVPVYGTFLAAVATFDHTLVQTNGNFGAATMSALSYLFVATASSAAAKGIGEAGWAEGNINMGTNLSVNAGGYAALIVAQGAIGGLHAVANGGKFKDGFRSAAVSKALAPVYNSYDGFNGPSRVAVAAAIGGTISELTGGKFASGAVTAAMIALYNNEDELGGRDDDAQKGLATSYAESNGEGWVDEWGNVYPPNPDFHNPEPGLIGVYPEALLPVGRAAQGVATIGKVGAEALALKATQHGAVRIGSAATRGGAASRFTLFKLRLFGQSTTASNGSRIYYKMTSSGRYNFSAYNNSGSLITSGQGWNARRLTSMAKRYGWEGF